MSEPMRCYRHPGRETRLSCATCGRPICTECMRQTDVGIKCPEDAKLPRNARAGVMRTNQIAKTVLAGVGVALAGFLVVSLIFQIGFGRLILSGLAGWGAGTLIHRAGGRNGGPISMTVSGVSVAIPFLPFLVPQLLAGNLAFFVFLPAAVAVGVAVYFSR
jgi:hypothetical protein